MNAGQESLNRTVLRPDFYPMPESHPEPLAQAPTWSRTIVYHASRDALGERTDVILSRLGYQMLLPQTFEAMRDEHPDLKAELLVVDERRLEETEASRGDGAGPPIVLLNPPVPGFAP